METLQGVSIEFYLNDRQIKEVVHPEITALTFIREQMHLTGAKEVCAEGDCGACTIALGAWKDEVDGGKKSQRQFSYQAINSCLLPAARLHGCHVITVEGLTAEKNQLHLIQQQMLEHHAVQCGYCTAGMIMSLFCLLASNSHPSLEDIYRALEGNLCRCTGYASIRTVALALANILEKKPLRENFFPSYVELIKQKLLAIAPIKYISLPKSVADSCEAYLLPSNKKELFTLMERHSDNFKIINGGTDLMVVANLQDIYPKCFIDLSKITEFSCIKEISGAIVVGGTVTLDQVMKNDLVNKHFPALVSAIKVMASNQIRQIATIAGNIVNASPIADSVCVLLALDASLTLLSSKGERSIKLADFYRDYKVTEINKNTEIVSQISIPIATGLCHFEKSSKRLALDISTVNSAIFLTFDHNNLVLSCRLAYGGVTKFPALAKAASTFLIGKKITPDVIAEAMKIVATEFKPIADVRGSAEYRKTLISNHLLKHFEYLLDPMSANLRTSHE